jgi:hypothetical protein
MLYANIKITEELEQMFFARETIMKNYGFLGFVYNEEREITNWEVYLECENRMYARAFAEKSSPSDDDWDSQRDSKRIQAQNDMIELLGLTHYCEKLMMKMKQ